MMLADELNARQKRKIAVWIPVLDSGSGRGVFCPKSFQIQSVGTQSIHLFDHDDVLIKYCYGTRIACLRRCKILYNIYTGNPYAQYPE